MPLQQIIYCSKANALLQEDVEEILDTSMRNNSQHAITGMLLFNAGYFLQLLEGPRAEITKTFCRISKDARHAEVELIGSKAVDRRLFSDWSMNYIPSTGHTAQLMRQYQSGVGFQPFEFSYGTAGNFCAECAELTADSPEIGATD